MALGLHFLVMQMFVQGYHILYNRVKERLLLLLVVVIILMMRHVETLLIGIFLLGLVFSIKNLLCVFLKVFRRLRLDRHCMCWIFKFMIRHLSDLLIVSHRLIKHTVH